MRGAGPQTKGVQKTYRQLLQRLGPELAILTQVPLEEIERVGGKAMAEGIRRMRQAEIRVEAGYDGEFGIVRLFRPDERTQWEGQFIGLTDDPASARFSTASAKNMFSR